MVPFSGVLDPALAAPGQSDTPGLIDLLISPAKQQAQPEKTSATSDTQSNTMSARTDTAYRGEEINHYRRDSNPRPTSPPAMAALSGPPHEHQNHRSGERPIAPSTRRESLSRPNGHPTHSPPPPRRSPSILAPVYNRGPHPEQTQSRYEYQRYDPAQHHYANAPPPTPPSYHTYGAPSPPPNPNEQRQYRQHSQYTENGSGHAPYGTYAPPQYTSYSNGAPAPYQPSPIHHPQQPPATAPPPPAGIPYNSQHYPNAPSYAGSSSAGPLPPPPPQYHHYQYPSSSPIPSPAVAPAVRSSSPVPKPTSAKARSRNNSSANPGQGQFIMLSPPGDVVHTDDAAIKLSDRVRRKCYNCATTDTSTWRRSNLAPGKVLCNKCGLFERTHSRSRPEQFPHRRGPTGGSDPTQSPPQTHTTTTQDRGIAYTNVQILSEDAQTHGQPQRNTHTHSARVTPYPGPSRVKSPKETKEEGSGSDEGSREEEGEQMGERP